MKLEISCKLDPIDVLGRCDPQGFSAQMEDYEVKIDDKICPPGLKYIILIGMIQASLIQGKTFAEIISENYNE